MTDYAADDVTTIAKRLKEIAAAEAPLQKTTSIWRRVATWN
jgi:hypothetical protein